MPSTGSPYKFHVDSIASGRVTAYGPGLSHGNTGEACNFTISTDGAGGGGLSLAVEGPSKAEVNFLPRKYWAPMIVIFFLKIRLRTVTTKMERWE